MIIGGFWHGAGWTFGLWGLWHGVGLMVNHWWDKAPLSRCWQGASSNVVSWALTFLFVVVGWIFFRAPDIQTGWKILTVMTGAGGIELPSSWISRLPWLSSLGMVAGDNWMVFKSYWQIFQLGVLMACVLLLPNALQIMSGSFEPSNLRGLPVTPSSLQWRPNLKWAILMGAMAALALLHLGQVSEFLYFQF